MRLLTCEQLEINPSLFVLIVGQKYLLCSFAEINTPTIFMSLISTSGVTTPQSLQEFVRQTGSHKTQFAASAVLLVGRIKVMKIFGTQASTVPIQIILQVEFFSTTSLARRMLQRSQLTVLSWNPAQSTTEQLANRRFKRNVDGTILFGNSPTIQISPFTRIPSIRSAIQLNDENSAEHQRLPQRTLSRQIPTQLASCAALSDLTLILTI